MSKLLRIDIWSDIICPFCWIGKRQLELALKAFPHKDQVEVAYHAFRLSPDQVPVSTKTMLEKTYGMTPQQLAQNQARVVAMAASVGLDYHLDHTLSGDTLRVHRLVMLAADQGLADVMIESFYRAYFTEGLNLFDDVVLVQRAMTAGLERSRIEAFLRTDVYADEVREDQAFIASRGAQGVPFFVFNDRLALSGSQPVEAFGRALMTAWGQIPEAEVIAGNVCGPDGCAV